MPVGEERDDVVLLDVPAAGGYLSVLPTATAAVATRLGFSLDEIEDLRAAVNAAVTLLLPTPSGGSLIPRRRPSDGEALRCRLEVDAEDMRIVLSRTGGDPLPDANSYQWQVLRALTDEVGSARERSKSTITIRQHRPSGEADGDPQQASRLR